MSWRQQAVAPGRVAPVGGSFRFSREQLPGAIQVFQDARDILSPKLQDAGKMAVMYPMGDDWVSHESAKAFNEGADRAREVWQQAVERLDDIIAQLRATQRAWEEAEQSNASDLRA